MTEKKEWMKISFFKNLVKRIQGDDVTGMGAQLAYYFLLSLFPLLIFFVTLLPYLPITQDDIMGIISEFAPPETMSLIEDNLNDVMKGSGSLLSFGIIATLWSASNGINALVRAFNKAYDVEESRSFIVARGMAVVLTVAMVFVFIVALLLPVFGKQIGLLLFSQFGFSEQFVSIWNAIRWVISALIIFFVFLVLYWIAPNKKLKCLSVVPGALFAALGWIITSLAFSFYVGNFGNYSSTYGSLGGIIVMMIWFYLSAIIIIIGGEINAINSEKKKNCPV